MPLRQIVCSSTRGVLSEPAGLEDSKRSHTSKGGNAEPGTNLRSTGSHDGGGLRRAGCGIGRGALGNTRESCCGSCGVRRDDSARARALCSLGDSYAVCHVYLRLESATNVQREREESRQYLQEVTGITQTSEAEVVKAIWGTVKEVV